MSSGSKRAVVLGMFALSLVCALPALIDQQAAWSAIEPRLRGRTPEERLALFDTPGYPLAMALARSVPADRCVAVVAYAGPAAVDYYRARLAYFLYPRRLQLAADSAFVAEDCQYLAVFHDTPANLATEPFAGHWDESELEARTDSLDRVHSDAYVTVYRQE